MSDFIEEMTRYIPVKKPKNTKAPVWAEKDAELSKLKAENEKKDQSINLLLNRLDDTRGWLSVSEIQLTEAKRMIGRLVNAVKVLTKHSTNWEEWSEENVKLIERSLTEAQAFLKDEGKEG